MADNRTMLTLRKAKSLARFMLVWFALTVGAAIASPMVKAESFDLICSGGGVMKIMPKTDDGKAPAVALTLDCPLCASWAAPPPVARVVAEPYQPLSYALRPVPAAFIAARTDAPFPARGPPAFS